MKNDEADASIITVAETQFNSVRIKPKFGHIREEVIFWNALIFTNHIDAISIPANDTRIAVFTNTDKPWGPPY